MSCVGVCIIPLFGLTPFPLGVGFVVAIFTLLLIILFAIVKLLLLFAMVLGNVLWFVVPFGWADCDGPTTDVLAFACRTLSAG